jgi:hypothetical protein
LKAIEARDGMNEEGRRPWKGVTTVLMKQSEGGNRGSWGGDGEVGLGGGAYSRAVSEDDNGEICVPISLFLFD